MSQATQKLDLKDCIVDAFEKLLKQKPIDKITVDEIVALAGVGRMTYFRNFSSKPDILKYKILKAMTGFLASVEPWSSDQFNLQNSIVFFKFNYSIKDTLKLIVDANMLSVLFEVNDALMAPAPDDLRSDAYKIAFFSYGIVGLLAKWAKEDFQESPEEMARLAEKWLK